MKRILLIVLIFSISKVTAQTSPCLTNPVYRQFDFWIGSWEVFALNGNKAGDSKITLILDSCVIFEEWVSTIPKQQPGYSGKSYNTYNGVTQQWQQTWVDNTGGTIEYLEGRLNGNKMMFFTKPFAFTKDTMALRKLSFVNLGPDRVQQLGEISKDKGGSWQTEFDLEYRRKKQVN